MKDITFGTLLSCMFLSFMLGFLSCHKLYAGLDEKEKIDIDTSRWDNPSLHGS